MTGRMRRLYRELSGRSRADFVAALNDQLEACLAGARIAHGLSRGEIEPAAALVQMVEAERRGDRKRAVLVERLSRSFVTPIDREDLFRVSRSIDDVLDNLLDYVREVDLLRAVSDSEHVTELTGAVITTVELMMSAVSQLVDPDDGVSDLVLAAKKSSGTLRVTYLSAIAELLNEEQAVSDESIRSLMAHRELLRRLDVVGLRLGEAADAFADGVIKRHY